MDISINKIDSKIKRKEGLELEPIKFIQDFRWKATISSIKRI